MAAEAQHSSAVAGALARGDAAILLRFPHKGYREKIWDHCAGAVIVEEAGARISDASGECLPLGYLWVQLVLAVFVRRACSTDFWCMRTVPGGRDIEGYAAAEITLAAGRCLLLEMMGASFCRQCCA